MKITTYNIIVHTGASGHRRLQSTKATISKQFYWTTLDANVQLFVSTCIQCLSPTGGRRVPRLFEPAVYGTRPNDLIQLYDLEMGSSRTGEKYILMLRDDHSGNCWLYNACTTDAATASDAFLNW